MKHPWRATLTLLALFLTAQFIGIGTAAYNHAATGSTNVDEPVGVGERPQTTGWASILFLLAGITISTAAILYIARHNATTVWKTWFALATTIALYLFFSVYVSDLAAFLIAATLTTIRTTIPHPVSHNAVELLMYAGIAVFLHPLFTVNGAAVLLAIMSAYDAYAVWQSQHMVTLADFTREASTFPGLSLSPANTGAKNCSTKKATTKGSSSGVLGGGDILFPLLTALTVFSAAAPTTSTTIAAAYATIIAIMAGLGLLTLFVFSQEDAYYPALPFITTGCYIGIILVRFLVRVIRLEVISV